MKALRLVGRLCFLVPLALALASCVGSKPTTWTLWYVPNEPKPGVVIPKPCLTYVFASEPDQTDYVVARIKGWTGSDRPTGSGARMHSGEDFSGQLDLGPATVHDESTGYDLDVDVIYKVKSYPPAGARADADCPIVQHMTSTRVSQLHANEKMTSRVR